MECGSGVGNNGWKGCSGVGNKRPRVVVVVVAKDGMEGRGGGGK